NVRELEHCLRAALALSPSRIDTIHLPETVCNPQRHTEGAPASPARSRALTPEQEARRDELKALLIEHRGNISQVARVMGKDRVQVRRWIKLFALSAEALLR